ncbi:MAG TPA: hypothetical protein VF615_12045 [Longimicrobiaceae bacterium]|jgi:hypothetical protein
MEKLKLDLDSLVVESFETSGQSTSRGTVDAYDSFTATTGGEGFCPYYCSDDSRCACA